MSKPIYGEAQVIAFPNLTAAQAIQVARDTERDLVQTRTGNFYLAERKVGKDEPKEAA